MEISQLMTAATKMLAYAYAPYSHFPVGAALLTSTGELFTGCNVENAAYGSTNCAERTAIFSAIAAGERDFSALLITAKTKNIIVPCGTCRQVINELCPSSMPIYLTNQSGKQQIITVAQLLPSAFTAEDLNNE